jgi:hypothetical protein
MEVGQNVDRQEVVVAIGWNADIGQAVNVGKCRSDFLDK